MGGLRGRVGPAHRGPGGPAQGLPPRLLRRERLLRPDPESPALRLLPGRRARGRRQPPRPDGLHVRVPRHHRPRDHPRHRRPSPARLQRDHQRRRARLPRGLRRPGGHLPALQARAGPGRRHQRAQGRSHHRRGHLRHGPPVRLRVGPEGSASDRARRHARPGRLPAHARAPRPGSDPRPGRVRRVPHHVPGPGAGPAPAGERRVGHPPGGPAPPRPGEPAGPGGARHRPAVLRPLRRGLHLPAPHRRDLCRLPPGPGDGRLRHLTRRGLLPHGHHRGLPAPGHLRGRGRYPSPTGRWPCRSPR